MKRLVGLLIVAMISACGGSPGTNDAGAGGGTNTGGGGSLGGGAGGGSGGGGGGGGGNDAGTGGGSGAECDKPANVTYAQTLTGAQPSVETRKKTTLTQTVTFQSKADDPSVSCSVQLTFKDSNGNGALDPYEDWRKPASERAADLLPRLSAEQKLGLLAHGTAEAPLSNGVPSGPTLALVTANLRFATTSGATGVTASNRATWANAIQEAAENTPLGVPFVISSQPSHSSGNGRVKAKQFSQWPNELSLAATSDLALLQTFGQVVAQEYRAVGVRMALGVAADLATEPRWYGSQFTYGEDATEVSARVASVVKGLQGATLGQSGVAAVVSAFPGAGPEQGGVDVRLPTGKFLVYSGTTIDAHLAPFQSAIASSVAGVMTSYGVPKTGAWTGLGGTLDGSTLAQTGASFSPALVTDALRTKLGFTGLVIAPLGAVDDAALSPLGAPWGVEALAKAARVAAALAAGVDQISGLDDTTALAAAKSSGALGEARLDAAATKALALIFQLGLFEDPYVDPTAASKQVNTDLSYRAGLDALDRGLVLLVNAAKPAGFLNGNGDGTQMGDKGNAGNGSMKVLPAPPGEPYVSAGCAFYVMGDFDLDYVRSVGVGYGNLTNDATAVKETPVTTEAEKMALSDYIFIRIAAPFTKDSSSGALNLPTPLLAYATQANSDALDGIKAAKAAIAAWHGTPASQAQIIVLVDLGRPSVVSEIEALGVQGLYVGWEGNAASGNALADKVFLDVAFGIVNGAGRLPVGLPASEAAAAAQKEDLAGDGQHVTFVRGYGLSTARFE